MAASAPARAGRWFTAAIGAALLLLLASRAAADDTTGTGGTAGSGGAATTAKASGGSTASAGSGGGTAAAKLPSLSVAGRRGTDPLKLHATIAQVTWSLALESTAKTPVPTRVLVAAFSNDARGIFAPEVTLLGTGVNGSELSLSEATPGYVNISVSLSQLGEYTSELTLRYLDQEKVVKLSVTREVVGSSFEILPIAAAAGDARPFCGENAKIGVSLHELNGRAVKLAPPVLTGVTIKGHPDAPIQALAAFTSRFDCVDTDPAKLLLKPGESCQGTLSVSNLDTAGEYNGTLRMSELGAAVVERPVTIYLRDSRYLAWLCILVGAGISMSVRAYANRTRPRLLQLTRCFALEERFRAVLAETRDDRERTLVNKVWTELQSLHHDIEVVSIEGDAAGAKLDDFAKRLEQLAEWLTAYRLVSDLQPEQLRGEFRDTINEVERILQTKSASDEQLAALRALPASIDKKVRETLQTAISAERAAIASEDLTSPLGSALSSSVKSSLDTADGRLAAGDLAGALRQLDEARRRRLTVSAEHLDSMLNQAPEEGDGPQWQQLRSDAHSALTNAMQLAPTNVGAAFEEYDRARSMFLRFHIGALRARLLKARAAVPGARDLNAQQQTERTAALDKGLEDLSAAEASRRARDLNGAAVKYEQVLQLMDETLLVQATRSVAAEAAATPQVPGPSPGRTIGAVPQLGAVFMHLAKAPATSQAVRLHLAFGERALTLVALLTALALGDVTLFESDLTWGGWSKCLLAVLWGLGLHEFSFQGLSGLSARLTGQKEAA